MSNLGNLFSLLDGQDDEGTSKIVDNVFASTAASREAAAAAKAKKAAEALEKKKAAEELERQRLIEERRRRRFNNQFKSRNSGTETLNQQGNGQAVYNNNNNGSKAEERPATGDSKRSEQEQAVVVNGDGGRRMNGNGYQNGGGRGFNNQFRPYNNNYNRNVRRWCQGVVSQKMSKRAVTMVTGMAGETTGEMRRATMALRGLKRLMRKGLRMLLRKAAIRQLMWFL
ncbi:hypothetical protein LINPERHAP1_LOCUS10387 [Linum perenne]